MDEIRAVAGPIAQRYFDKVEAERSAQRAAEEAELQKKKEMAEAARAAAMAQEAAANGNKDEEMTDADTVKPDEVVEPESK
jgi:heat shock protein 4